MFSSGERVIGVIDRPPNMSGDMIEVALFEKPLRDSLSWYVRADYQHQGSKFTDFAEAAKVAPGGDPAQVPRLMPGVQSSTFRPDVVVRGRSVTDSYRLVAQPAFLGTLAANVALLFAMGPRVLDALGSGDVEHPLERHPSPP